MGAFPTRTLVSLGKLTRGRPYFQGVGTRELDRRIYIQSATRRAWRSSWLSAKRSAKRRCLPHPVRRLLLLPPLLDQRPHKGALPNRRPSGDLSPRSTPRRLRRAARRRPRALQLLRLPHTSAQSRLPLLPRTKRTCLSAARGALRHTGRGVLNTSWKLHARGFESLLLRFESGWRSRRKDTHFESFERQSTPCGLFQNEDRMCLNQNWKLFFELARELQDVYKTPRDVSPKSHIFIPSMISAPGWRRSCPCRARRRSRTPYKTAF